MTYLEKINGEYPNLSSMETRVAELTQELKDISAAGGGDDIIYKLRWDERASLKREINALKVNPL